MSQATVTAKIHQPFHVHRHVAPKIALDHQVSVDVLANSHDFGIRKFIDPARRIDPGRFADLSCRSETNAMNIGQRDGDPFLCWDIHTCNASHSCLPVAQIARVKGFEPAVNSFAILHLLHRNNEPDSIPSNSRQPENGHKRNTSQADSGDGGSLSLVARQVKKGILLECPFLNIPGMRSKRSNPGQHSGTTGINPGARN